MTVTTKRRGRLNRNSEAPADVLGATRELGIDVHRVDLDEAWALCPAHLERTGKVDRHPSWSVNLDSGIHNCFSCGFKGNFTSLVRYLTDDEPSEWIRRRGGLEVARKKFLGLSNGVASEEPEPISEADLALFVDPPREARDARDVPLSGLVSYGVRWDAEHARWIFPIRDPDTYKLRGWQEKGGTKGDRYFNNYPRRVRKKDTFFGIEVEPEYDKILLVESPINAVRGFAYMDVWGLASMGAKITSEQISLLSQLSKPVVAAFDLDKAGDLATKTLHEQAVGRINLSFLDFGDVEDLDDMSDIALRSAIDHAIPSWRMRF